ncbi:5-formyltetrahydrofolate cyclo-ligase [Candidozyma auris]|uniref:5-formyltetrahydrofolate cyclo-ligase n=1 Tax=Candidozyma auris TaxID=498019 RepID=A0A2H1A827_CANAR|nr:5-formyltetrahydrofolate cyclo-ligase [[Candida] auris]
MITGMLVSYNELVLDAYSKLSYVNHSNLDANSVQFLAKKLPTYEHLAKQTSNGYWRQLRAWDNLDRFVLRESGRSNTKSFKKNDKSSLTNTILARPGGIVIEPIIFKNMKENMTVTIVHAGDKLCGYPFLVHGGIIATFLNETFKRNASLCNYSIKEQWNALYAITLIVAEILLDESGLKGRQFKALARVSQRTRAKAEVNNHAIGFSQSSSFFSEQQERVWEEGYSYFIKVFPLSNSDVDFSLDNFLLMLGSYNINNLDCSIYATQSHLNHNCEPNTEVDSGETRGSFGIKVLSSRFISAGEELTTTATSVGLFMNMPCEVNTEELIHHCFKAKKKVYLPRCEIANGGSRMRFLQVNTFEEVQMLKPSGKLALREPKQGVDIMDDGPLDVLVVPGLGFTLDGRRLGRGAAYYDKFLASYFERFRQKPYLIGICFVEQLVDNIPTERHDWNLDEIVSGNNH